MESELNALIRAIERYRDTQSVMDACMRDGANVHGSLSRHLGATDMLDDALCTAKEALRERG